MQRGDMQYERHPVLFAAQVSRQRSDVGAGHERVEFTSVLPAGLLARAVQSCAGHVSATKIHACHLVCLYKEAGNLHRSAKAKTYLAQKNRNRYEIEASGWGRQLQPS